MKRKAFHIYVLSTDQFDAGRQDRNDIAITAREPSCTEDIIAFSREYLIRHEVYNYVLKAGFKKWYLPNRVDFCTQLDHFKHCTQYDYPEDYKVVVKMLEYTKFACVENPEDDNDPDACTKLDIQDNPAIGMKKSLKPQEC